MKAWFRSIAAAFKSEPLANSVGGISVLALSIYTGYSIPKPSMIGALRWISYINVRARVDIYRFANNNNSFSYFSHYDTGTLPIFNRN